MWAPRGFWGVFLPPPTVPLGGDPHPTPVTGSQVGRDRGDPGEEDLRGKAVCPAGSLSSLVVAQGTVAVLYLESLAGAPSPSCQRGLNSTPGADMTQRVKPSAF